MIISDGNNLIANGSPESALADLTLVIRAAREQLRGRLSYLDTDDLVREAIRMGMMSDEDLEKVLDGQRKEILEEE